MPRDSEPCNRRRFLELTGTAVCALAAPGCNRNKSERPKSRTDSRNPKGQNMSDGNPVVVIETSMGTIKAQLWSDRAPGTVKNFLRYTDEEFFDGLIFHRVIPGFMIQGGGFTPDMQQKPTHEQIRNEAAAALKNDRGTLAMARTGKVHSATAQFFVNLADNDFLNHRDETARGFGYCAFGKVIDGMEVVDAIAKVKTATRGRFENVPVEMVEIKSIRRAQ